MRTLAGLMLNSPRIAELPPPEAPTATEGLRIGLAVESMRRHTTDEGWQLFDGLQRAGYRLHGYRLDGMVDVRRMLPAITAVVQDKREWDLRPKDFREKNAAFKSVTALKNSGTFVVTVLKDAHQRPEYHRDSAEEMGVHAWIVYYTNAKRVAPYVRERHLVRVYHTVDFDCVPDFGRRGGCILSGAVSSVYPLRERLFNASLPWTKVKHPGYHMNGCATPDYLRLLSRHKVAVCTTSVYGYALRKLIEATACGCAVLTDLPVDEVLPGIDENFVRVDSGISAAEAQEIAFRMEADYDEEKQKEFTEAARWYDYRAAGVRLAADLEAMRCSWKAS